MWNILLLAIIFLFLFPFFFSPARTTIKRAVTILVLNYLDEENRTNAQRKKNLNRSYSIVICYRDCHTQTGRVLRFHSLTCYLTHPKHLHTPSYRSHCCRLFTFCRSPLPHSFVHIMGKNLIIYPATFSTNSNSIRQNCDAKTTESNRCTFK